MEQLPTSLFGGPEGKFITRFNFKFPRKTTAYLYRGIAGLVHKRLVRKIQISLEGGQKVFGAI